jgi:hypothetical protein
MNFYYYPINEDTTLDQLIQSEDSLFRRFRGQKSKLLNFGSDEVNEKSNYDRIVEKYSKEEQETEAENISSRELNLVKGGTTLLLPKGELDIELVVLEGRNIFIKNVSTFKAYYGLYLELLRRDGFSPKFRTSDDINDIDIRQYHISIWVWSRAYSKNGTTLLDLTKFVENCTTVVNGTNNSFSISLQPVNESIIEVGDEVFNRVNLDKENKWNVLSGKERLPMSWFNKILQKNDIVFIRFEQLEFEKNEDRDLGLLEFSASNLPGKVYDMIGLIDTVNDNYSADGTNLSVSVVGNDLTNILIEDGSYFFPLLFTENADTLFFNTQDDSKWFKRNFIRKEYENLFIYKLQSIKDSLGFVINQLSNLGVCNDDLFSSYDTGIEGFGGRRGQTIRLTGESKNIPQWNVVCGIWQIVDLLVDSQIDDRRIVNSQIANPNGNLLGVVEGFCERPFVEFFGDTYGDKFTFIARQPPYTKEAILSVLNSIDYIDVNLRDVERFDVDWESTYYTWFQMDPRNMFLGRSESIALAYLPVVYFPEIAEAFGNKQLSITDNYISNKALVGPENSISHDEFKQKVIEDFLYIIESFCNLPFTRTGTITLKRDRRLKAKTWVKVGMEFFYIESVTNSFIANEERVDGNTTITVSRGMYIDFIRGKFIPSLGKKVDYWSMVKLDVIRKVLIEKLKVYNTFDEAEQGEKEMSVTKNTTKVSFGTDRDVFDFFLQRGFLE